MSGLSIAAIALKLGAPLVAEILRRKGGRGGKIAGKVITDISAGLGAEPKEEAIVEAYKDRPAEVTEVITRVEQDLAEIARTATEATISYHRLIGSDRDAIVPDDAHLAAVERDFLRG